MTAVIEETTLGRAADQILRLSRQVPPRTAEYVSDGVMSGMETAANHVRSGNLAAAQVILRQLLDWKPGVGDLCESSRAVIQSALDVVTRLQPEALTPES